MKLTEDIKPITYMKTRSSELINTVRENRRPIVITQNGEARAVIMDIDSYEKQKDALLLLKIIAQGESEIKDGKIIEQEKFFRKLEKKFNLG
ncbi:MAG TPA: type II toxin-antitoxin system Phd/YefM family antitoxin [Nitrospiraceae bacterium]|nr:MAG: prevent-host-death protein [Nitrospirae bacterium GWA2_46_11]OGW25351.1 MAG: prevent-host-death protein [Nitrospirae bacterium GWB2_47_37]HAK87868.1 type II toxin-antitoxin system Phd/YefM family antitoxin [Nitrospiraceae bacterium]HCL81167.1 type II toxin-antitoxin system Phd/YefM family antitoxin [Nitrospiraceae bacterium]HCZ11353.1 type II toxin-antitoxin system Phd/YefM family antitoxin [Nitrospiraceae bacterium]